MSASIKLPDSLKSWKIISRLPDDNECEIYKVSKKNYDGTVISAVLRYIVVKDEEYNDFYTDKFYDYEKPLKVISTSVEGLTSYNALLFIPSHAPYNYYTKEYEKGLMLYSKGVMIMDKCADLLPDYFSFVKGIVDSEDISLNISRETMQEDKQVKLIARSLETKIKKELQNMLKDDRDNYLKFYEAFGEQLKYGIYSSYGMKKEFLQDLLLKHKKGR